MKWGVNGLSLLMVLTLISAVRAEPSGLLNDTGQTQCLNVTGTALEECTPENSGDDSPYPGQDGRYGRDAAAKFPEQSGFTKPEGSGGHGGFAFTPLDVNGNPIPLVGDPPVPAETPRCIWDRVTNLIWEVKTDDGGLQDKDWTYGYGNRNFGFCNNGQWPDWCGTNNYIFAVNSSNLCPVNGSGNWRMPATHELLSIVDYAYFNPSIDGEYFPNSKIGIYWAYPDMWDSIWRVSFDQGIANTTQQGYSQYVRLVRNGPGGNPVQTEFIDNGDGTITDTRTNLNWDKCSWGQTLDSTLGCAGAASLQEGEEAKTVAMMANRQWWRGHSDWRIPNISELYSLQQVDPNNRVIIDNIAFPNTPSTWFWTSTACASDPSASWGIYFHQGNLGYIGGGYTSCISRKTIIGPILYATRLVRGGQSFDRIGLSRLTAQVTAQPKTYDGTNAVTISCDLIGVAAGDTVTCSVSSASFADANAGSNKTVTAIGITLAGADAGKYTLMNTTATTTADILKAPATVTLANLSQTYTGSPLSPSATTSPASLTFTWTGAPQTNAGSYPVTATIHEQNYQGSASGTFVIQPAPATVTLADLSQTYTGLPLSPTVTTVPAGLTYSLSGAPQTHAGTYPVTATITNPNYSGTASGTFNIVKIAQAPVFINAPNWVRYQQSGMSVLGYGGSGTGTFTYSASGSTACTVHPTSGALSVSSGTGTCQVTATKLSDPQYLSASSIAANIMVLKALQAPLSISATPPSITSGGPATTLSATGGSTGGTVTYAAVGTAGLTCTISGNTLKATGSAGTCSVTGTMAGNGNYEPVSSAPLAVPVLANVAPVAVNDSFTLLVNGTTPVTLAAPGILANDTDANSDALKVAGITPRTIALANSGGRVTLQQNGSFTYTPPSASFSGTRTFTYQVTDGKLTSNTATVTLTIARRPTANADTTATALNTAKVISVLANDSATPPATLNPASLVIVTPPANGSAQANTNGTITYTPTTGFAGTNTFTYTVRDSLGSTSNPAIVTVHVPQARPDSYSVTANTSTSQTGTAASVALNDVPNVSGRTFTRLTNPIRTGGSGTGTLTITSFNTGTGAFSYRLSGTQANKRGSFQFSYRMSLGGVNTAAATVTIMVR